jgi:hypothetical protein
VSGGIGEFRVVVDGVTLAERGGNWFTRSFTGYPNLDDILDRIARRRPGGGPR